MLEPTFEVTTSNIPHPEQAIVPPTDISPEGLVRLNQDWHHRCLTNPNQARADLYPYLAIHHPQVQEITDCMAADPHLRVTNLPIDKGKCTYYGVTVTNLPETAVVAEEVAVGLLVALNASGIPVCLVDLHPDAYPDGPPFPGEEIRIPLIPPEDLIKHFFARPSKLSKEAILDFLTHHMSFFIRRVRPRLNAANDQAMPEESTLVEVRNMPQVSLPFNVSILPVEGQIATYSACKAGIQPDIAELYQRVGLAAGYLLGISVERPEATIPLARLANRAPHFIEYAAAAHNWLYLLPSMSPERLPEFTNHIFDDTSNREDSLSQAFGWAFEIEGFSYNMAETISEAHQLSQNRQFNLDLSHAVQRRSRKMLCDLALYTEPDRLQETLDPHVVRYFQEGIKSQLALINLMATKGVGGLASDIRLPDYLFKRYRNLPIGDLNAQQFLDSIVELWEEVYIAKQRAAGIDSADAPKDEPVYGAVDADKIEECLKGFTLKELIPSRIKSQLAVKCCFNNTPFGLRNLAHDNEENRESLILDIDKYPLPAEIEAYEDKVALMSFKKGEFMGLIIENEDFAVTLRSVLKYLFDITRASRTGEPTRS